MCSSQEMQSASAAIYAAFFFALLRSSLAAVPVNPIAPPSTVSVPETDTYDDYMNPIYTVAAYDPDGNYPLSCSLSCTPGCPDLDITDGENGCTIVAVTEIDFDAGGTLSWAVTVTIVDSASETLTMAPFDLEITDVDDERPFFNSESVVEQTLDDDAAVGTTVYTVPVSEITERDAVTTSLLYWLSGDHARFFRLQSEQVAVGTAGPVIQTATILDYENEEMRDLDLYVSVSDRLNDHRDLDKTTQFPRLRIPVAIDNLNDHPIKCASGVRRARKIDGESGTLLREECRDPDTLNFKPTCALDGTPTPNPFTVAATGQSTEMAFTGACVISYTDIDYETASCNGVQGHYCFDLLVSDQADKNSLITTATVHIVVEVLAAKDGAMSLSSYSTTVDEDAPVNTCFETATLMAFSDQDSDLDHYWSFSPTDGPWIIDPTSGQICLTQELDYEMVDSYRLTITVQQRQLREVRPIMPDHSLSEIFNIGVNDVNDEWPWFHGLPQTIEIIEDTAADTNILQFRVSDQDTVGTVAVTINSQDPDDSLFTMAACSTSCVIALAGTASLDTLKHESYVLTIHASDGTNTAKTNVIVAIIPVNDQTPTLTPTVALANPTESTATGTLLATVAATDGDYPSYLHGAESVFFYISGASAAFDDSYVAIDRKSGEVRLMRQFDIDDAASVAYEFEVTAIDERGLGKAVTTTVSLTVGQANDRVPFCPSINQVSHFVIDEDNAAAIDLLVFSTCEDQDGNTLTITLQSGTGFTLTAGHVLSVDADTLDYDTGTALYTAVVRVAESGGTGAMSAAAAHTRDYTVKVVARAVNDGAPSWTTATYTATVAQNALVNTAVTLGQTIDFTDPDGDDNTVYNPHAYLSMFITSCSCAAPCPFAIDAAGAIRTVRSVDKLGASCVLKLTLTDRGGLSSGEATLTVTFTAVNHAPTCHPEFFSLVVPVDTATSTTIIDTPSMSCLDYEDGTTLTYSMTNTNFAVDGSSGALSVSTALDYTAQRVHDMEIEVEDSEGLTTTVTVQVVVSNTNQFTPDCTAGTQPADDDVAEGTPIDTVVATISCPDDDDPDTPEGMVRYTLTGGDGFFSVGWLTGEIKLVKPVDYEKLTAGQIDQTLNITAQDLGKPAKSVLDTVVYTFTNDNDNAPTCEFSYATDYPTGQIPDGTASGVVVGKITCTDLDSSAADNTDINLSITSGGTLLALSATSCTTAARDQFCSVDVETAAVWDFDAAAIRSQELTVAFVDDLPANSGELDALFTCVAVNEAVPTFDNLPPSADITLAENAAIGTLVYDMAASDDDSNVNNHGKIRFELVGMSEWVAVSPDNGQIKTRVELDYESLAVSGLGYEFETVVRVRDLSEPPSGQSWNTATVTVTLTDVDDETPYFTNAPMSITVDEGAAQTGAATLTAKDPDTATASLLFYERSEQLTPSAAASSLVTVNTDGSIDISSINAETIGNQSVLLGVRVCDAAQVGGSCARYSDSYVYIKVRRTDEFDPIFPQASYAFTVTESDPVGTLIGRPRVSDSGAGVDIGRVDNAVSYSFTTDQELFVINPTTGAISLRHPIDRELNASVALTVRATSLNDRTRSEDVPVTVTVTDVNDNYPICDQGPVLPIHYVNDRAANAPLRDAYGTALSVTCSDPDAGNFGTAGLEFDFTWTSSALLHTATRTAPADPFLQSVTGGDTLTFSTKSGANVIDWQQHHTDYLITVTVTDNNAAAGSKVTYLYIPVIVKDADIEAPAFTTPGSPFTHTLTIPDTTAEGTLLYTLVADQTVDIFDGEVYSVSSVSASLSGSAVTMAEDEFIVSTDPEVTEAYLYLNTQLDAVSTADVYVVEIVATDTFPGSTRVMPTATVTVSVTDANNNQPYFLPSSYHLSFPENPTTSSGDAVVTVRAFDGDDTDTLTYAIVAGSDSCSYFTGTQDITFGSNPDFEAFELCTLSVSATDGTSTATALVTVEILPVNEAAPTDDSTPTTLSLPENSPVGTVLGAAAGVDNTDKAGTPHSTVVYRLVSATPPGYIVVEYFSGDIVLKANISRENVDQIDLEIEGCDLTYGLEPDKCFASPVAVQVTVTDVNEFAPVCDPGHVVVRWSETTASGADVIPDLDAICSDADATDTLTYAIGTAASPAHFVVTGTAVESSAALDFETTDNYYFTVIASDGTLEATVTVSVEVLDDNDNSPVASGTPVDPASPTLAENVEIGTYVATVSYTDEDSGDNGLLSYSISGGHQKLFVIDSESGVIYTGAHLSFLNNPNPTIDVEICDNPTTGTPNCATQTVNVALTDVNTFAPSCTAPSFVATADDNTATGTSLQTITGCTDLDSATDDNNLIQYTVIDVQPSPTTGSFVMNAADLEFDASLNLEAIGSNYFEVTIQVADVSSSVTGALTSHQNISVFLSIDDVNEEEVFFSPNDATVTIEVTENVCCSYTGNRKIIHNFTATDLDYSHSRANVSFTWQIVSGNALGKFMLEPGPTFDTAMLVQVGDLDREELCAGASCLGGEFSLVIQVADLEDGASTQYTDTQTLVIDLMDINDNLPLCVPHELSVDVVEGTVGPTGFELPCTDKDELDTLTAAFGNASTDFEAWTKFEFITGPSIAGLPAYSLQLNVTEKLDYERFATHDYRLRVLVSDGSESHVQTVTLTVNIIDVDEGQGDFVICDPIFISESVAVGSTVLDLPANGWFDTEGREATSDPDNPYETFSWTLGMNAGGYLEVEPTTGVLKVAKKLDREVQSSPIDIRFNVNDGSGVTRCTTTYEVVDENDQLPEFIPRTYFVEVTEGVPVGTFVTILTVVDEDLSTVGNGIVSDDQVILQSFIGPVDAFQVDACQSTSCCGVTVADPLNLFCVSTNSLLTYHDRDLYKYGVTATDNADGDVRHSGYGSLTVKVLPENRYAPSFRADRPKVFTLPEDSSVGRVVGRMYTVDRDTNVTDFGEVHYEMDYSTDSDPTNAENHFAIDKYSGAIRLLCPLDYQTQSQYKIRVKAYDSRNRTADALRSSITICINVEDTNDNYPRFVNGRRTSITVDEDAPVGSHVTTVSATDADTGFFGLVYYQINDALSPQCDSYFVIGERNAELKVRSPLDYETLTSFTCVIEAYDHDDSINPDKTSTAVVHVLLTDINDNAPSVKHDNVNFTVLEQVPVGTSVGFLQPYDLDSMSTNGNAFTFTQLSDYTGIFSINFNTGEITMARVLNRDTTMVNSYELFVEIADTGTNHGPRTGTVTATVCIIDDNSAPIFEQTLYEIEVPECVENQTYILKPTVDDADRLANSRLTFQMTSEAWPYFAIDPNLGWVYTFGSIMDREDSLVTIEFEITAWDNARPDDQLNATAQVVVTIVDCNDNAPYFLPLTPTEYSFSVSEAANLETTIGTVSADDDDQPGTNNSEVRFEIVWGDADGLWEIDPVTGVIKNTQYPLDRDPPGQETYYLLLRVYDLGEPSLSSERNLTITLLDENDNAPVIGFPNYTGSVLEQRSPPITISLSPEAISATDIDKESTVNSALTYTINATYEDGPLADAYLDINANDGTITTKLALNETLTPFLYFEVYVTDAGTPQQTSRTYVNITVIDINDNAPEFIPASGKYHAFVPSFWVHDDGPFHYIEAFDIDDGANAEISYFITGGNSDLFFEVDAVSGNLRVRPGKSLEDKVNAPRFQLTVTARDHGVPQLQTDGTVYVKVFNADDKFIAVTVQSSYDTFGDEVDSFEQEMTEVCQAVYVDCKIEVSHYIRNAPARERSRRSSQTITVFIYGLQDTVALQENREDEGVNMLSENQLLAIFQEDANGEPVTELTSGDFADFPVEKVEGYQEEKEEWMDTPSGLTVIIVAVVFAVLVLVAIAALVWFMWCRRSMRGAYSVRKATAPGGRKNRPPVGPNTRRNNQRFNSREVDDPPARKNVTYGTQEAGREQLARKANVPIVAPAAPPPKVLNNQRPPQNTQPQPVQRKESQIDGRKKDPLQVKPKADAAVAAVEKPKADAETLKKFNGMAQDPNTGRFYAYNTETKARKWLTSKEVEFMRNTLNK